MKWGCKETPIKVVNKKCGRDITERGLFVLHTEPSLVHITVIKRYWCIAALQTLCNRSCTSANGTKRNTKAHNSTKGRKRDRSIELCTAHLRRNYGPTCKGLYSMPVKHCSYHVQKKQVNFSTWPMYIPKHNARTTWAALKAKTQSPKHCWGNICMKGFKL